MSDKDGKDAICVNDPNYAIICKFLQKFAVLCNITTIDTIILQKQIENTDEGRIEIFFIVFVFIDILLLICIFLQQKINLQFQLNYLIYL